MSAVRDVVVVLPRPSGIPIHAHVLVEVSEAAGEVNYRRVTWKMGRTAQDGDIEDLIADWKGDSGDPETALQEIDNLVLQAVRG